MGLLIYLLTLAIIVVGSNQSIFYKVSDIFKERDKSTIQLGFTVALVALFTMFYFINYLITKEGFFFEVSDPRILGRNMKRIPRDAIYDGKPISFEFDSVGSGMCSEAGCNNYGMIKGCPNGRSYGTGNTDDNVL
jgi:hypothetical protein